MLKIMMHPKVLLSGTVSKIVSYMASSTDPWGLTKRKIAQGAGISEVHLHRIWPILDRYRLVEPTRKVGPATLYVVNKESPIVWFYLRLLEEIKKADAELVTAEVKKRLLPKKTPAIALGLKGSLRRVSAVGYWKARALTQWKKVQVSAKKFRKKLSVFLLT